MVWAGFDRERAFIAMRRSEIHSKTEEAVDEAIEALEAVFQTHYTSTKTPVTYTRQEMNEWMFQWEHGGFEYRFSIGVWEGTVRIFRRSDGGDWETLLEHK